MEKFFKNETFCRNNDKHLTPNFLLNKPPCLLKSVLLFSLKLEKMSLQTGAKSEFRVRFWRHIGSVPKNAAEKDYAAKNGLEIQILRPPMKK